MSRLHFGSQGGDDGVRGETEGEFHEGVTGSEAIAFRTKAWVPLYLLCFSILGMAGVWFFLSQTSIHRFDLKSLWILFCSLAFIGVVLWMARSIPARVVFDVPARSIKASYFIGLVRSFRMDEVTRIEWRANMYAKQLGLLLHFRDGQRLLIPQPRMIAGSTR